MKDSTKNMMNDELLKKLMPQEAEVSLNQGSDMIQLAPLTKKKPEHKLGRIIYKNLGGVMCKKTKFFFHKAKSGQAVGEFQEGVQSLRSKFESRMRGSPMRDAPDITQRNVRIGEDLRRM